MKTVVQPMVSLEGLETTLPVVLRLRCGSGPMHVRGQHLAMEKDAESKDEEEEDM